MKSEVELARLKRDAERRAKWRASLTGEAREKYLAAERERHKRKRRLHRGLTYEVKR